MTEAVAVPRSVGKPKSASGKTVFAGVMVFALLVAFATAFYLFGGVDIVSGLVDSWFAATPPASSTPGPSASDNAPAAVAPTATPAPAPATSGLPEGVDEAFAKRVYVEQLESQVNITKLVEDKVSSFSFGKVKVTGDRATIPLTVTFTDKTSAPGTMVLARKGGKWYLESVAGERKRNTKGLAVTVAADTDENSPEHVAATADTVVDEDVLSTMLEQQAANQEVISAIVEGGYTRAAYDELTQGPGTTSIDITLTGPKKAAMKGRVLCISKDIDGTKWFLTSFTKS